MFISFEGIEGVGKSTQLKFLAESLEKNGIPVLLTREPGGTEMGEEIRDILLKHRHEEVSKTAELLLMFAARVQHVETIIKPALKQKKWVLSDRFSDATYAYQGGGRGVAIHTIMDLEALVLDSFHPDLTIILDAPPTIGLQRMLDRGHPDRFEEEKLDFFERVRMMYLERAKGDRKRYKIIDATKSIPEIQETLLEIIQQYRPFMSVQRN